MPLSERFFAALDYAARLHAAQTRKGSGVPYVAHLLAVASLVLDHGGDEEEAIAALLHDAVEDQGGAATAAEIRRRFGDRVADIVIGCSDTDVMPKPPWRARKEAHLLHLQSASRSVLLVSAADKLHNARSMLHEYRHSGEELWSRFNGGREGTLWYLRSVVDTLKSTGENALVHELERIVAELEGLIRRIAEAETKPTT
jgi:(p)ppGpp synthase/HD superfamily hydrolase